MAKIFKDATDVLAALCLAVAQLLIYGLFLFVEALIG